jgi:hypothetical protein
MKNLRQVTQKILQSVEEISGKSIQVMRDESLPVLASLTLARNQVPFHILRYKPSNDPLDYFVAHQAGFVLRLYGCSPTQRFDFCVNDTGTKTIGSLLSAASGTSEANTEDVLTYSQMLSQWALMNLRSLPIGMRIDEWISKSFPELEDLQKQGIAIQQQQNINLLAMKLGKSHIPTSLMGPVSAYALFGDRLMKNDSFSTPFIAAGLHDQGVELLKIWDAISHEPSADCQLVDAWAETSQMRTWYEWTPHTS